jgi:hypothetical protein
MLVMTRNSEEESPRIVGSPDKVYAGASPAEKLPTVLVGESDRARARRRIEVSDSDVALVSGAEVWTSR